MKKLKELFSSDNLISFSIYFLAAGLALVFFPALWAKAKSFFTKSNTTASGS